MLLLSLLVAGCSSKAPSSSTSTTGTTNKGVITIGYVDWEEDVAMTYVWQKILEDQGYTVKIMQVDVAPLFVGLSNGDRDLYLDGWLPVTQKNYWDKYQDKLVDFGDWYQGPAKTGWVVPQYVTLDSIYQLKGNEAKFNNQLIGIDPGAEIMQTTAQMIKDQGLNMQLVQGSEAAMEAALAKAYRAKQWIVFIGWNPHWMFVKYQLKYLDDGGKYLGNGEGLHVLGNKDWCASNPEIVKMMQNFKMTGPQLDALEKTIYFDKVDPQTAADQWVANNQDLVRQWVGK